MGSSGGGPVSVPAMPVSLEWRVKPKSKSHTFAFEKPAMKSVRMVIHTALGI